MMMMMMMIMMMMMEQVASYVMSFYARVVVLSYRRKGEGGKQ